MAKTTYIRFRCTEEEKALIEAMALASAYDNNMSEYILGLVKEDARHMEEIEVFAKFYNGKKQPRVESVGKYLFEVEDGKLRTSKKVWSNANKKAEDSLCPDGTGYQQRIELLDAEGRKFTTTAVSDYAWIG